MEEELEIWRNVAGYEGLYEVSSYGRVKSLPRNTTSGKVLSVVYNNVGRASVILTKNGKCKLTQVSRTVAFAFPDICGNYFEGAQVNHLDENPKNNNAYNIRWCTCKENINYGTRSERQAEKLSKTILQFDIDGNFIKKWKSAKEIERALGFASSNISSVCKGKFKQRYGYKWRYGDKC